MHCDTIRKLWTLVLDVFHILGAPLPAKPLPSLGDEWRSEFYNMQRMLLNQAEKAHSNPPFLRRSIDYGRTGLMCQSIEVEEKPVIEDYQRSIIRMKRTQDALCKRMHHERLDGE